MVQFSGGIFQLDKLSTNHHQVTTPGLWSDYCHRKVALQHGKFSKFQAYEKEG